MPEKDDLEYVGHEEECY